MTRMHTSGRAGRFRLAALALLAPSALAGAFVASADAPTSSPPPLASPTAEPAALRSAATDDGRTQIFPALHQLAPILSNPATGPQWDAVSGGVDGVWMNAVSASADEVAGMLAQYGADEYPVILPGACSVSGGQVTCGTSASMRRTSTANARLDDVGKRLVPVDRAFNLAPALGDASIDDIVAAIDAAEDDPAYSDVRSGILVHPRDGLDQNIADTRRAIDAIDDGGVVAIEVSASLLDAENRLRGMAEVWRYAQSEGKQAVWLLNGPRGEPSEWITNIDTALTFWEREHDLAPDVIAPIATMLDDMAVLPEGDGGWPPDETFMSVIHALLVRSGSAGEQPPTGLEPRELLRIDDAATTRAPAQRMSEALRRGR